MRNVCAVTACLLLASIGLGSPAYGSSDVLTFVGSGWGHGVGMPQWGAYQQAVEGRSEQQILASYYPNTTLEVADDSRQINVNVAYRVTGASVVPVALGAQPATIVVGAIGGTGGGVVGGASRVALLPQGNSVVGRVWVRGKLATTAQGRRIVVRWSGSRLAGPAGSAPAAVRVSRSSAGWAEGLYRDGLITASARGSQMNIVNNVRVHDEYLNGIAEVSASWPMAALRAQAITARSYALSKTTLRTACDCHVDNGRGPYSDQTFIGYARVTSSAGGRWVDAVRQSAVSATAGRTLMYEGQPIAAFYYAASGGRTANSEDVWGGKLAWARSVADPWSLRAQGNPNRQWRISRSRASVAAAFGLPDVAAVTVTSRDASGQARSVVATAADGRTATLSGSSVVARLGLTSRWIQGVS